MNGGSDEPHHPRAAQGQPEQRRRRGAEPDGDPGVRLDADEVVLVGRLQEHVLVQAPDVLHHRAAALVRVPLLHGVRGADPRRRPRRLHRWQGEPVAGDQPGDRPLPRPGVVRPRREAQGPEVPAERHDPRLVDRAVPVDPVTERPDHRLAVAGEAGRGAGVQPPAAGRDPAGEGEVVERHHRRQAGLAHRVGHPPVVVELALRERRPPRARSAPTRPSTGRRSTRGRPASRRRRGSAGSGRRRRRSGPRTGCPDAAPSPTSRCRCCRPRPGGPPWPCPTGTTAGRRGRSSARRRVGRGASRADGVGGLARVSGAGAGPPRSSGRARSGRAPCGWWRPPCR